jgi:acyl dehydratase
MEQLRDAEGLDLGTSEWFTVSQDLIDVFSKLTTDDQWIHTDIERAAKGPFGTTIAHGYLIVSLISQFLDELLVIPDRMLTVNYGIDRLRFTGPVKAGSRIRATMSIARCQIKSDAVVGHVDVTLESEGEGTPALVGTVLFRFS